MTLYPSSSNAPANNGPALCVRSTEADDGRTDVMEEADATLPTMTTTVTRTEIPTPAQRIVVPVLRCTASPSARSFPSGPVSERGELGPEQVVDGRTVSTPTGSNVKSPRGFMFLSPFPETSRGRVAGRQREPLSVPGASMLVLVRAASEVSHETEYVVGAILALNDR